MMPEFGYWQVVFFSCPLTFISVKDSSDPVLIQFSYFTGSKNGLNDLPAVTQLMIGSESSSLPVVVFIPHFLTYEE